MLFPGALPAAGAASPSDTLAAAGHTSLHNTGADEARAIATKVGTGSSTPVDNSFLVGNGVGTSSWETASTARSSMGLGGLAVLSVVDLTSNVTGILPVANGGTGQANLTSLVLTTPVIADFSTAQHDHSDAGNGGVLGTDTVTADMMVATYVVGGMSASFSMADNTDWQDTGFDIVLPSAGVWVVHHSVRMVLGAGAGHWARWRVWNESTGAVAHADSVTIIGLGGSAVSDQYTASKSIIITTSGAETLRLEAALGGTGYTGRQVVADTNGITNAIAWRIA